MYEDPLFNGRLNKDFRLTEASPCIDAGHPDSIYNDPDGSCNDMGKLPYSLIEPEIICGDADGSGLVNILDVTRLINYLYKGGPAPDPLEGGDSNGSGQLNILDVTYLINFLYKGGPDPICP